MPVTCDGCSAEVARATIHDMPGGLPITVCAACEKRAAFTLTRCPCGARVKVTVGGVTVCACGRRWCWWGALATETSDCARCPSRGAPLSDVLGEKVCAGCAVGVRARAWTPRSPICILCGGTYAPETDTTNCCGCVLTKAPASFVAAAAYAGAAALAAQAEGRARG